MFGGSLRRLAAVQAICDHVHKPHPVRGGTAAPPKRPSTRTRKALRRLFATSAHLAICFCRLPDIPARYCTAYGRLYGPSPQSGAIDFSGLVRGLPRWLVYTFDARYNTPRIGRVLIARGRDAADVPFFAPAPSASTRLTGFEVDSPRPCPSTSRSHSRAEGRLSSQQASIQFGFSPMAFNQPG